MDEQQAQAAINAFNVQNMAQQMIDATDVIQLTVQAIGKDGVAATYNITPDETEFDQVLNLVKQSAETKITVSQTALDEIDTAIQAAEPIATAGPVTAG